MFDGAPELSRFILRINCLSAACTYPVSDNLWSRFIASSSDQPFLFKYPRGNDFWHVTEPKDTLVQARRNNTDSQTITVRRFALKLLRRHSDGGLPELIFNVRLATTVAHL